MPKSKKNVRSQRKSSGKSSGKSKRKLNAYFKQMLSAKKQGLSSEMLLLIHVDGKT